MASSRGNKIPNQFIVTDCTIKHVTPNGTEDFHTGTMFQSYSTNIAFKTSGITLLDRTYWNYSTATGKYHNIFLNETRSETEKKINTGVYTLTDLNP